QAVADPRAWTAATVGDPHTWYYPLPEACLAAFEQVRRESRDQSRPVTAIQLSEPVRTACASALQPVREALESGRAFAIIESPPRERRTPEDAHLLYWVVGLGLGRPFEQNVQGTLLYDVRDTGQDLAAGARFSVTNYESSFHTDNSFGTDTLDYVGLLCL